MLPEQPRNRVFKKKLGFYNLSYYHPHDAMKSGQYKKGKSQWTYFRAFDLHVTA